MKGFRLLGSGFVDIASHASARSAKSPGRMASSTPRQPRRMNWERARRGHKFVILTMAAVLWCIVGLGTMATAVRPTMPPAQTVREAPDRLGGSEADELLRRELRRLRAPHPICLLRVPARTPKDARSRRRVAWCGAGERSRPLTQESAMAKVQQTLREMHAARDATGGEGSRGGDPWGDGAGGDDDTERSEAEALDEEDDFEEEREEMDDEGEGLEWDEGDESDGEEDEDEEDMFEVDPEEDEEVEPEMRDK